MLGQHQSPSLSSLIYFIESQLSVEAINDENSDFLRTLKYIQKQSYLSEKQEINFFHAFWMSFIKEASAIAAGLRIQLNMKTKIECIKDIFDCLFDK